MKFYDANFKDKNKTKIQESFSIMPENIEQKLVYQRKQTACGDNSLKSSGPIVLYVRLLSYVILLMDLLCVIIIVVIIFALKVIINSFAQ